MAATVGGTIRVMEGLESIYVETFSPALIDFVLTGAGLVLRDALRNGVDLDELALALATSGMSVTAASLFDTVDPQLQPLSARYREYSRADFCVAPPSRRKSS